MVEEDKDDRWLIAMELMLYVGHTLLHEIMKKAEHERDTICKMMDLGVQGDFWTPKTL